MQAINTKTAILWAFTFIFTSLASEYNLKSLNINPHSTFVLGGLFPVHRKGVDSELDRCGLLQEEKGIQRLEAMLYALDQINNDPVSWPFKLGATILDTCTSDSFALEQSLQFLHYSCGPTVNMSNKITAVVGASNSDVSEALANIFRLFEIPQVSYASTSEELDDLYKYKYFFRVVPSDRFQVRVILDILLAARWTYVSVVASQGEYGELAVLGLQKELVNSMHEEICITATEILKRNANDDDYDVVVQNLDRHEKAKVVIVFLNEDKIGELLEACERNKIPPQRFLWLGSDGWGTKERVTRGYEKWALNAITIMPKRFQVKGFDDYFKSLKPSSNTRNPWFEEFWETQFTCKFGVRKRIKECTGDEDLKTVYRQEGLVPMVIDSVYLLATAIRALICPDYPNSSCTIPESLDHHHRNKLVGIISNISMNSSQGNGMVIRFDESRSVPVNYTIYQYQETSENNFSYVLIGEWNPNEKLTRRRNYSWKLVEEKDSRGVPISRCSKECKVGWERVPIADKLRGRCCWECRECTGNKYLPAVNQQCTECPKGEISNSDKTGCIAMKSDYVGKNLGNPWALVPFIFSVLGLICTTIVFVIFFLNHKTPLLMASGRELCYVILLGIVHCYCFPFIVLLKPTEASCGALRIFMGLGLSICYSAIFTKTNRICRIFEVSMKITKRPSYISPGSQVIICVCLVLIQVTVTVLWLIIKPPVADSRLVETSKRWVEYCELDGVSISLGLLYNMVLLILCTVYAYKTRNIPENFNETKWISFTTYSSCIIWFAFIPIYFSALQDYKVQATTLSMCVSFSGTVTLVCIFLPKIYIVLFHPERNVRYPSSPAASGTSGISELEPPVRFLGTVPNSGALQQSPNLKRPESPFPFLQKPAANHQANSF
ncbi:hypothetical protein JTE90_020315 [Oedothorax gibbosus]|uniref:G-protein coupled receptors family 3 profile domain-containing protein n=1 Tax=Oedothorax gibbosus TaxID=931172 RepID=A0AAV6VMQ1_9ARAC|nr:hypothetical protein JTE90_020315 [Oedothorax gibbosus]